MSFLCVILIYEQCLNKEHRPMRLETSMSLPPRDSRRLMGVKQGQIQRPVNYTACALSLPARKPKTYRTSSLSWAAPELENPGLFLEPADVFHDLINIVGRHPLDLRHVAEFPMVRPDAVGRCILEGRVAVMIRFINLMDERRTLIGSHASGAVTARALGAKLLFSLSQFGRSLPCRSLRLLVALAASRCAADQQHNESDAQ